MLDFLLKTYTHFCDEEIKNNLFVKWLNFSHALLFIGQDILFNATMKLYENEGGS